MRTLSTTLASILLFTTCAAAGDVTVKGSDTMVVLAQRWAEAYMKETPGTVIQVTGGGSGTGIAALLNGTTDIANSSRPIKPKEASEFVIKFGKPPTEIKTSLDGLAVYLNEQNPIQSLTIAQLDKIFCGEITNFKAVGGPDQQITLYSRENNSGTYAYFKEHVLKDKDFAASAQNMAGTSALINAVAKDPAGIGYGGIGYAKGARAIAIKADDKAPAVKPEMEKVVSGEYPLSRYLFVYTNPTGSKTETQQFVDWILTQKGQSIVADCGYFPLPGKAAPAKPPEVASPSAPEKTAAPESVEAPARSAPELNSAASAKMLEREASVAAREATVAEREAAVALREFRIAGREARLADRELTLSQEVAASNRKRR